MTREYPVSLAGPYEGPPRVFEDRDGRRIEVRRYGRNVEPLVAMYRRFDPEDRAQGIPPAKEDQIRAWLTELISGDSLNVIAYHDGDPIGHAMLVPDEHDTFELAIFVLGAYQDAGIGTELIKALLGVGRECGIERVWLTVERWNTPATTLYRNVGFVPIDDGRFELEMAATLSSDDEFG